MVDTITKQRTSMMLTSLVVIQASLADKSVNKGPLEELQHNFGNL